MDALNATLPAGVRVYQTTTPIVRGGAAEPLRAWLVRLDTARATWRLGARLSDEGGETAARFAQESGVRLAMNAGYFGGATSYSLVAEQGSILAHNIAAITRPAGTYYPTRGVFGQGTNGRLDVAWVYTVAGTLYRYPVPSPNTPAVPQPQPTATFPAGGSPWTLRTGVGGGPVLVEGGVRRVTFDEEVMFGSGAAASPSSPADPRTAIGYTASGEVLAIVAEGRTGESRGLTLNELADAFVALGATEALNLDGGGSSQLSVVSTAGIRTDLLASPRAVAAAFVVVDKAAGPATGETYDFDADPTKPATYGETGSWIESGNTPFHGTTKARLTSADGSGDRGVFRLGGIPAGTYDVSAWWVPSSNRSTATPYVVYHGGSATTVRVNQADAATLGKWNPIGRFTLAAGDSVVVSDAGSGASTYVVADGLRLARVTTTEATSSPLSPGPRLRVFPVPARGALTVEVASGLRATRGEVLDLLGRTVARFDVPTSGGLVPVDLGGAAPGVYVVRVGDVVTRAVVR